MKHRRLATLCVAATILFPAAAKAACSQDDFAGTWQAYSFSVNGNGYPYWSRCKMNINGTGDIANTTCFVLQFGNANLTQGKVDLTNASTCTWKAEFKLGGVLNKVVHATLSKDKEIGQGVGTFPNGGMFTFNMTKF